MDTQMGPRLGKTSPHTSIYYGGLRGFKELSPKLPSRALELDLVGFGARGVLELPGIFVDRIWQVSGQMKPTTESRVLSYKDADPIARQWFNALSIPVINHMIARCLKEYPRDFIYRMATAFTGGATSHSKRGSATFLEQLHPLTDLGKRYLRDFWAFKKREQDPDDPEYDGREYSLMAANIDLRQCEY